MDSNAGYEQLVQQAQFFHTCCDNNQTALANDMTNIMANHIANTGFGESQSQMETNGSHSEH